MKFFLSVNVYFWLSLILAIAFLIRIWQLWMLPMGLYWDEADFGYQAFSLLTTGRDYFGNYLPLFFHSFADFRPPLFTYSLVPFIYFLGLNEFSTRLPSVIFGVLGVLSIYFLTKEISGKRRVGLIACLMLALSPWHIHYSRIAFDATQLIFFLNFGIFFFLKGVRDNRYFILSAIFLGSCLLIYSTAKLFIPLLIFLLIAIYFHQIKKSFRTKNILIATILFILISTPLYAANFFGGGGQRFEEISIFTDPTISSVVDETRLNIKLSRGEKKEIGLNTSVIDKIFTNKVFNILNEFSNNYLTAFSTDFLFVKGDPNLRHSPSKFSIGQMYPAEALTLILGLFISLAVVLFKTEKEVAIDKKPAIFLIFWLIIAPIAAALTREGAGHATRLIIMLPPLIVLSSLGFNFLLERLKSKVFFGVFSLVVIVYILNFGYFVNYYFSLYKWESALVFGYELNQMAKFAERNKTKYDQIIIDDNKESSLIPLLFFSKYDPYKFQTIHQNLKVEFMMDLMADKIDNIYILQPINREYFVFEHVLPKLPGKTLVIISARQVKELDSNKFANRMGSSERLIETFRFPDNLPLFYVVEHQ